MVTISHDHFDHNAVRVIKGDYVVVKDVAPKNIKGVAIRGITGFHDDVGGEKRGRMNIFHLTLDSVRFCHLGDPGPYAVRGAGRGAGRWTYFSCRWAGSSPSIGAQAQELVRRMSTKVAIPMHFRVGGLSLSIHNADEFLSGLPEDRVVRVGNEVEFEKEELPESTEYWVFSQ